MSKQTLKYEYIKPTNIESEVPGPGVQNLREPPKNGGSPQTPEIIGISENMSKQTLKYEYMKPTNIESEVPAVQKLRKPPRNGVNASANNSNTEHEENFVPVLTMKKEETALTTGDFKLQKVLVTENVAQEDNNNTAQVTNPLYSEIQSMVILGPQPIREYSKDAKIHDENKDNIADKDRKDNKPNTKIPTKKFKETVRKVQRKQKSSSQEQDKIRHAPQRRSSIPKPRRKRNSTSISEENSKINDNVDNYGSNQKETTNVIKPDEEFEKLYDEIADDKQVEPAVEKLLPEKIEDTEKLEKSFEEIIHAYDENKTQPPRNNKSKIPLSKQRSLHDESVPKQVERRLSLKTISINDREKQIRRLSLKTISINDREKHNATQIRKIKGKANSDVSKIPVVKTNENKPIAHTVEENTSKAKSNGILKKDKEEYKTISINEKSDTTSKANNNSCPPRGSNEQSEQKLENVNEGSKSDILIQRNDTNRSPQSSSKMPDSSRLVMDMFSKNDFNDNNKNENYQTGVKRDSLEMNKVKENTPLSTYEKDTKITLKTNDSVKDSEKDEETRVPLIKGKVSSIINKIHSNDGGTKSMPKKEIDIIIPKKKSVFSKIALFERQSNKEPITKKSKQEVYTIEEININDVENRKPKIIASVVKSQPLRKSYIEDNVPDAQITSSDYDIIEPKKDVQISPLNNDAPTDMRNNENRKISKNFANDDNTPKPTATEQSKYNKASKLEETVKKVHVFEKPANEIDSPGRKVQDFNIIRSKSVAKLDIDDTVKGKVHQMVVRMNSSEIMEVKKKEVINVKERPRKRSVSEKIALFERKLTPVRLDTPETTTTSVQATTTTEQATTTIKQATTTIKQATTTTKQATTTTEQAATTSVQATSTPKKETNTNNYLPKSLTEEEYAKRIEDLENAAQVYGKVENMPYVSLRDGKKMPILSVGTALLDSRLIQPVIKAAIDLGYRAIDAAFVYGNEKEIGEAIRAKIEDGTVTRADLFIVNKLWNSFHRQDLVVKACTDSLATMGLEYFDLYLVHSPISFMEGKDVVPMIANVIQYSHHDYLDAWYGMEQLVNLGYAKSIGVSNFNSEQITKLLEKARIKPVINQVECHPYLTQERLGQFCEDRDIKLSCFGVLGSKGTPTELKNNLSPVIDDSRVTDMAKELNVTAAQVLVRYQIHRGHLVVVKSSSAAHLWNNLKALDIKLTETQLDRLNKLNKNKRTYTFKGMGETHRNYPFSATF